MEFGPFFYVLNFPHSSFYLFLFENGGGGGDASFYFEVWSGYVAQAVLSLSAILLRRSFRVLELQACILTPGSPPPPLPV